MADNIPNAEAAPGVETSALPTPYDGNTASPDTFGAGVGAGMQRQGELADHIATVARTKANEVGVQALEAQGRASLNKWVLDPKAGFASLRGADAMAKRDEYLTKFNKELDDISANAPNDEQRRMFGKERDALRQQGMTHAYSHENHEQNGYAAAQIKGNLDQSMIALQNVIGAPNAAGDPRLLQDAIQTQVDAVYRSGIEAAQTKYGQGASKEAIASVVMPELQRMAVSGMETATASQNPAIARAAFDKLGKYLVTAHQRQYSAVVQGLEAKREITKTADEAFQGTATAVLIPGMDTPVVRVDRTKLEANVGKINADDPHAAEKIKAIESRAKRLDDGFNAAMAAVQGRIYSAGQDPVTGEFSIDSPRISVQDKVILQQNRPALLGKLRDLDQKIQRQGSAEEKRQQIEVSRSNYSAASSWLYDDTNKSALLQTTRSQFAAALMDDSQYPGGFTNGDRAKALSEFDKSQKIAQGKLDERTAATVKESLEKAFPTVGDAIEGKEFHKKYFGALLDKANAYVKANKGDVDTEKLRAFVEKQLAEGKVVGSGWVFDDTVRLIEAQGDRTLREKYKGKTFKADDTGETTVLGGEPQGVPVVFPRPTLPAPGASPAQPDAQDQAAIDWLNDPKNSASPKRATVLAKLKAKGLAP